MTTHIKTDSNPNPEKPGCIINVLAILAIIISIVFTYTGFLACNKDDLTKETIAVVDKVIPMFIYSKVTVNYTDSNDNEHMASFYTFKSYITGEKVKIYYDPNEDDDISDVSMKSMKKVGVSLMVASTIIVIFVFKTYNSSKAKLIEVELKKIMPLYRFQIFSPIRNALKL